MLGDREPTRPNCALRWFLSFEIGLSWDQRYKVTVVPFFFSF